MIISERVLERHIVCTMQESVFERLAQLYNSEEVTLRIIERIKSDYNH